VDASRSKLELRCGQRWSTTLLSAGRAAAVPSSLTNSKRAAISPSPHARRVGVQQRSRRRETISMVFVRQARRHGEAGRATRLLRWPVRLGILLTRCLCLDLPRKRVAGGTSYGAYPCASGARGMRPETYDHGTLADLGRIFLQPEHRPMPSSAARGGTDSSCADASRPSRSVRNARVSKTTAERASSLTTILRDRRSREAMSCL